LICEAVLNLGLVGAVWALAHQRHRRIPGRHLEILSRENLPVLAKSLTVVLQRKQANERTVLSPDGKTQANLVW
jgi:hypothetical protein